MNKKPAGFTLTELLVVVAVIGILAGLLLPVLARTKAKVRNSVCTNNLRQLGIATRLYSEDNGSRMPSAEILPTDPISPASPLPRICDVLASYLGKAPGADTNRATVFKCPSDKAGLFTTEGSSYEWNADLNGERIDQARTKNDFMFLLDQDTGQLLWSTNRTLMLPPRRLPFCWIMRTSILARPNPVKMLSIWTTTLSLLMSHLILTLGMDRAADVFRAN